MRISDWSSDVCSSDLACPALAIKIADAKHPTSVGYSTMHRPIHAIHGPYRADVTDTWSSSLERQHHPNRLAPSRTPCRLARHAATVRRQHPWRRIRRLDHGPGQIGSAHI